MLISSNAKEEDIPFESYPNEFWTNNQTTIWSVLDNNDDHFREIYEKYKK
jgi:hypothetical protein